jgi:hypothetical protein
MPVVKVQIIIKFFLLATVFACAIDYIKFDRKNIIKCSPPSLSADGNKDGRVTYKDIWPAIATIYSFPITSPTQEKIITYVNNFFQLKDSSCHSASRHILNFITWVALLWLLKVTITCVGLVAKNLFNSLYKKARVTNPDGQYHANGSFKLDIRFTIFFVASIALLNYIAISGKIVKAPDKPIAETKSRPIKQSTAKTQLEEAPRADKGTAPIADRQEVDQSAVPQLSPASSPVKSLSTQK